MRSRSSSSHANGLASLLSIGLALAATPLAASAEVCDRACLEGLLRDYVEAVVAHEPERLPLAREVKFTENGQRLPLGDGLWHTATGKGAYALELADVERGQAVLMGTIREADTPTVLVARLGVAGSKITEIETLVIRDRELAERLDVIGEPRRTWYEPVAAAERLPLAEDCARLENGLVLAGDIALVSPRAKGRPNGPQVGCLEQFRSGVFYYVTRIRDRRFVLVDTERSLVFAFAFFDNAGGDSRFGTLADGRKVESGPKIPWTWQIAEVFKIENGKIGPVESVIHPVPYGLGSGWSTWEDSLSSQPRG